MITIYILCAVLFVITTVMLVLYFRNDKERHDEIKELKEKVDYYIKVLKDKGVDNEQGKED